MTPREEIAQLLSRVGSDARTEHWNNGNGAVVCSTAKRADGRTVRFYSEGTASVEAGESAVLAAIKRLVGA